MNRNHEMAMRPPMDQAKVIATHYLREANNAHDLSELLILRDRMIKERLSTVAIDEVIGRLVLEIKKAHAARFRVRASMGCVKLPCE